MSWLEELEYSNEYLCPECNEVSVITCRAEDRPEEAICGNCGANAKYQGFKPIKLGGSLVVQFEKNGRIGYAVKTGDKTTYISKTKMEYMKTGQNKSHLSKEYERHVQDNTEREFGEYRKKLETNATVSQAGKGAMNEV